MRAVRATGSMVVFAIAAWLIWNYSLVPYRCNRVLGEVQRRTLRAFEAPLDDERRAIVGRENLATLRPCTHKCSQEVAVQMVIGANDRLLQRWDDALFAYRQALQYDRRPEIFLNIGFVLLQQGKREEAIQNFEIAASFNPHVDADIRRVDPGAADRVVRALHPQS